MVRAARYARSVGLRTILGRVDRAVGRFNRWLAPAAVAEGTLQGGAPQHAEPGHVAAVLGELQKQSREPDRGGSAPS